MAQVVQPSSPWLENIHKEWWLVPGVKKMVDLRGTHHCLIDEFCGISRKLIKDGYLLTSPYIRKDINIIKSLTHMHHFQKFLM